MEAIGLGDLLAEMVAKKEKCDCEECRTKRGETSLLEKSQDIQARVLLDSFMKLSETFEKKPGMLIVPKKGLYHGYNFRGNAVLIITRVFDPPLPAPEEAKHNHYGRTHDIAVLEDNERVGPVEFVVDSRYFEPYTGKVA